MDRFAALDRFVKVVESGSFAAAARALGVSRSQVNRLIAGLEDQLGVSLFNRTTRSLSLTPAGQAFHERAKAIVDDLNEAMCAVSAEQDEPRGVIRLNAPMSFGTMYLADAITEFMQRYPDVQLQLRLTDRFVDPLSDGVDLTIRIAAPGAGPSLIEHDIATYDRRLYAAPALLARTGTLASPQALAEVPCLHYGRQPHGSYWHLQRGDARATFKVQGVVCSNNAEVLSTAAVAGLGVVILPRFIAEPAVQRGQLVPVLDGWHAGDIHLCLLYAPSRHMATRIRVFVRFMQARFGKASD